MTTSASCCAAPESVRSPTEVLDRLTTFGFVIVPGPVEASELPAMASAYDEAIASENARHGSTSVRGGLSANRCFDAVFAGPMLSQAARHLIGPYFKLSGFHARSVRPGAAAQRLHRDVERGHDGWPLLGFILMIDSFTPDNGATRFLPMSQRCASPPEGVACESAFGNAGSMILFDGSVWHGHGSNGTGNWRRSIQAALIPRDATSAVDHAACVAEADRQTLSAQLRELMCL